MVNKIFNYMKKIIMSFFILYGYNLLVPAQAIIPINISTVLTTTLFNMYGLVALITIKIVFF